MLAVAKITAKGQTTIPQAVRAALNVSPGDLDADAFNTAAGHAVMAMIISQDIRPGRSIAW
jgi:bifunctional DNA-binding transcriptional regulator/antitoxin component of YhaV-PrlF toxin-antitoxin module